MLYYPITSFTLMPRESEGTPIDAKRLPGVILIGVLLMAAGMIVFFYGMYSIVKSAIAGATAFELMGGLLIMPIGVLLMAVGGMLLFAGTMRKLADRKYRRRMLY